MSTFVPNPLIGQELERSPQLAPAMDAIAQVIAEDIRRVANETLGADDDYSDQIAVEVRVGEGGKIEARVTSSDFAAGWLEFGTVNMAPRAIVRRGAEAAGMRLEGTR